MTNWYIVVYEGTRESLGCYGSRIWLPFESEAQYLSGVYGPDNPHFKPIHAGLSEIEANDLVSVTPEICELAAYVWDMAAKPTPFNTGSIASRIYYQRKTIIGENLIRPDATKYVSFLKELGANNQHGRSTENLKIILKLLKNDSTGQIRLSTDPK